MVIFDTFPITGRLHLNILVIKYLYGDLMVTRRLHCGYNVGYTLTV